MAPTRLTIYEEIMLLALRDEEGTVPLSASGYPYAIAAGLLAELYFGQAIVVAISDDPPTVQSKNATIDLASSLLVECLDEINQSQGETVERWISRFASISKLKHRVAKNLVDRGILRVEDERVFLAFSRKVYPEIDHAPEQQLIDKLEAAIFKDDPVDPRTAALVAIADSVELLAIPFSPQQLSRRKQRIHDFSSGEHFADAARAAYEPVRSIVHAVSQNVVVFRN